MKYNQSLLSCQEWIVMSLKKNKIQVKKSLQTKLIQLEAFPKWKVKKIYIDIQSISKYYYIS